MIACFGQPASTSCKDQKAFFFTATGINLLWGVELEDSTVAPAPRRPMILCVASSVVCTDLEHGGANHFEIVELRQRQRFEGVEFLRLHWRSLPLKPGAKWTTTNVLDVLG